MGISVLARDALDVPVFHRGAPEVEPAVGARGRVGVHALRADGVGQVGRDDLAVGAADRRPLVQSRFWVLRAGAHEGLRTVGYFGVPYQINTFYPMFYGNIYFFGT